ncbi:DUF547 domain-containing protein [Hymenobacter sp. 15J16-1T3B]|uniref:DUF547 domain-containing protein n=1 Tax=Hymenobacter sp. 15J16-1T3B TaxID=2886941 RepID=UPI001D0FABE9|nr:DUF547 domain-containing protein [Hymenobacter sp. 15J16-1T3B]MCC3158365.1 DUF547 domain-containing protein [Hymenobacter sp. 15J16-1T3B]
MIQPRFVWSQLLLWLTLLISTGARADNNTLELLHQPWDDLLKRNVQADGRLSYADLAEHDDQLRGYLQALRRTTPQAAWSRQDQAAFWLNVYNAYTVHLAVEYYPVQRLSDIKVKTVGGYRSVWEAPEVNVGGKQYSLNQIEREILPRLLPQDPRRFLALHCAAASSPTLLPEAFSGPQLDAQLDAQARRFVNDATRNQLTPAAVQVSSVFDWHAAEFGDAARLVAFLNRYAQTPVAPTATVQYLPYDWSLNEAEHPGVMAQRHR